MRILVAFLALGLLTAVVSATTVDSDESVDRDDFYDSKGKFLLCLNCK